MSTQECSSIAAPSEAAQIRVGLRKFFAVSEEWGLNTTQQRALLGNPGKSTFFNWRDTPPNQLAEDRLARLSYLVGIDRALRDLFPPAAVTEWLHTPNANPMFNGEAPIQYMQRGLVQLADVRRYLDWARG